MPDKDHINLGEGESLQSALQSNGNAVKAVAATVETTLGPKGLDTMLVDSGGKVIVTNDGFTILDRMAVKHPAASMIVNVAKAQQEIMGDGTTTATLLATALVEEGAKQVARGVPVAKIITGMQRGIRFSLHKMKEKARPIWALEDEWLQRIAYTASRENEDITLSVIEAAQLIGREKLMEEKNFKLSSTVVGHPHVESHVFSGILINKARMNSQMLDYKQDIRVLVLADALEPDLSDEEASRTDVEAIKQERSKEEFLVSLEHLIHLNVGLIVTARGVDPHAEEVLTDAGIMVVQHVTREDLSKVAVHTGARLVKRSGLFKSLEELEAILGFCAEVEDDEILEKVRISGGRGKPYATILVGAATEEVVEERERICKDAAAAVQAALREGYVPGGGAIELSLARDVENFRDTVQGMERFGVSVVSEALQRPMTQVVANAGFNPLEKIELVKAFQLKRQSDSLGIDCDRGTVADMIEMGVVDPLLVKYHALQTAGEVSTAILRIHTIVQMKDMPVF
ncbi:TCP-1/cpn60 chaperonin family protein [Hazenella coriacea]|uniref:Chaperonin GroEL (HSP60 family) n=1 Tax=Hazenella coriacea TaxID=1179467 RepID=A0A4R3LB82_9BACL|nr:TCP-1/cpn60 chaperonin family protein [Hazenella coriacea]TCS94776.1 chaperonin GroEL (HSP60 family) [Hazenella coriacea]